MTTQPASPTVVTDGDRQVLRTTAHPGPLSDRALVAPPADRHAKQLAARDLAQLRRFQWAVRAALGLGVAASVCANVLHAQHNVIAQTIAAWPPLALMLTVELISRVPVYRRTLAAARILATISIAGIAAYVSYFHMAAVVSRYGEHQPNPYLLPISVDGLIVVASVSLVELAGRVRAIRDTPSGVHRGDSSAQDQRHADAPSFEAIIDRARNNGHVPTTQPENTQSSSSVPATDPPPVELPVAAVPTLPVPESRPTESPLVDPPAMDPPPGEPTDAGSPPADPEDESDEDRDTDADPELAALLPAARAAREALRRNGRSLTRDSLAAQLRRDGHTIRTSRVSALLNLLRTDEPASVNGRRASPSH